MSLTMSNVSTDVEDEWERIVRVYGLKRLSDTGYFFCGVYLTIIGTIATAGNTFVLLTFIKDRTLLRKPQNLLLVNLAVSDLGISLFGYPWTTMSNFAGQYLFGEIFCSIQGFLCFTFAQTDMNTLACLSVFRYITICYPQYEHTLNYELSKMTIMFTWAYTLIWTTPPLFGWSSYTFEPFGTSCSIDWTNGEVKAIAYTYCLVIFCYLIHVVVMVTSYYKIVKKVREVDGRTPPRAITNPRTGEFIQALNMRREKKVTVTAFLLNATFIILWLPYTVVCLWSVYDKDIPIWWTTLPTFFAKATCMTNPFLYFLSNSTFRKRAVRLFRRRPNRVNPFPPRVHSPNPGFNKEGVYVGNNGEEGVKIGSTFL